MMPGRAVLTVIVIILVKPVLVGVVSYNVGVMLIVLLALWCVVMANVKNAWKDILNLKVN